MSHLAERQKIDVLSILGYGDKTRTHKEIYEMCNNKYPERHIFQSTVSRLENKFLEFGTVLRYPYVR